MTFRSLLKSPGIGANCYYLDLGTTSLVLDSGMDPTEMGYDAIPNHKEVAYDSVGAIVISHAHHDHIGSLPLLQRRQPHSPVYMTEATARLSDAMLHNSVNVMTSQREEMGLMEYPLFTHQEVDKIIDTWRTVEYERPLDLGDEVKLSFYDAGHLLGSAGVLIEAHGQRIFYTGDVNFEDQTIMRGAKFPSGPLDTLIIETTRGDAPRRADYSRAAEMEKLATAICETIEAGGSIMLPVFALGKSQEMLMMLHLLQKEGRLPEVPIFLGGLSTKITTIYDEFADRGDRQQQGFHLLSGVPTLQRHGRSRKKKKRVAMEYQAGTIYLLSSGMMTEGTVSYEFAYQIAGNPANAVFFVGYTDRETPGYAFKHAKAGEPCLLTPTSRPLIINCRRETFDFSGHSEREAIRRYCVNATPKRIILVHGDMPAMQWFQQTLAQDLPQCEIIIAQPNETLSLD